MTDPTPEPVLPMWPTSEPDAATMIAWYAGHGLAATNRFYATKAPDPSDEVAHKRWLDNVLTLAHCYNVAACLIALREADPGSADRTAALLWWMAEAGEQGEYLHEWSLDAGLDVAAIAAGAKVDVVCRGGELLNPEVQR